MAGKHIVLTTWGSFGDVNPYLGLALGLAARGHRPAIATSAHYRPYVEAQGIEFRAVRPDGDPDDRALVARVMDPKRGSEVVLREILMGSLRDSYADLDAAAADADLLVTHPVTFAGPIVAERRGIPWVSTVLAPISFFSRHDLPVFPGMEWAKRLGGIPGAARALVLLAKRMTRPWTAPVGELRRELGLPPAGDPVYEGQHSPHGVLALFSQVLAAPQPDWPPRVTVTGAVLWSGPARGPSADLEAFLAAGPPPVVFTLGSAAVSAAGDFYDVSLEAVRRLGVRAVMLVGSHAENRPKGDAGKDVLLLDWAPHGDLFPRAAANVLSAGIGTLHQALRAGRPLLVLPFAHDQPDNAWRAARLGGARILRPRRYRVRAVVRALGSLLRDPDVAACARTVAEVVRSEDGVRAACDAIGEVLAG